MSDQPKILLVDDDPLAVALTREALSTGFEFADASDGERAL
jgi:CheY-like chemotaxis protein